VRLPSSVSAIASGSGAARNSSALENAIVFTPFVTSVHDPTSSGAAPEVTMMRGATPRSSAACSLVSRPTVRICHTSQGRLKRRRAWPVHDSAP
jgi:hypothetical protein